MLSAPSSEPMTPARPPPKDAPPKTSAVTAVSVYVVPWPGSPELISAVKQIAARPAKMPDMRCAPMRTMVMGIPLVKAARSSEPIRRKCV